MNFLESLSQHILHNYKGRLQHLTVILPNVRSRLFLSRYIQEQADQAIFLPHFVTSKELMEEIAGIKAVDDFFLLTKLFNVYQKQVNDALTFETFMNWGTTLLQDLKEIDHQLVDASELFAVLIDVKQLDFWNPSEKGLSEFQKKYLDFCRNLLAIYQAFNSKLHEEQIGHAGYIDKMAAQNVESYRFHKEAEFIVVGFNALTKAEESVFNHLKSQFTREMIFDYDQYYTDNQIHEAGLFARINQKKYPELSKSLSDDFKSSKEIDIYKCTTSYEQALLLNQLLKGISSESDLLNTAVILPDEGMLIPVLQHLPDSISKVNVTMGYSLQNSPYFEYIEHIFRLFINAKKDEQGKITSFYYKDVISFLHFNTNETNPQKKNKLDEWLGEIINQNQLFISFEEFVDQTDIYLNHKDLKWEKKYNTKSIIQLIRGVLIATDNELLNNHSLSNKINREFLLHHMQVLTQVEEVVDQLESSMDIITFHKLWKQYTKIAKVQFTGEPLAGLQIMGILESRTLDFEEVIILNVNEGSLPDEKKVSSLIPNDLKRKFGMNLNGERDAVIAYHFYRLLQRAKKIKLLYSNQVDSLKGGEKSRYIIQLKKELIDANPSIIFKEHSTYIPFKEADEILQTIEKTAQIQSLILAKFKSGLSPTSLINFINCPLNFYFLDLIKLKGKEELTEFLTQDKIGSIIHSALEVLYKPFIGTTLVSENIDFMKKSLKEVLKEVYKNTIGSKQITNGKNVLAMNMAEKMIMRLLEKEEVNIQENSIKILALEVKLNKCFQLKDGTEFTLKGIVDRIELKNGILHLIDYKTGKVAKNELQIKSDSSDEYLSKEKVFQLLTYALLAHQNKGFESKVLMASIYTLKTFNELAINLSIDDDLTISTDELSRHKNRIIELVTKMIDPTVTFEHAETGLYCNYC